MAGPGASSHSLLGVFYGIGALGMPFVLAALSSGSAAPRFSRASAACVVDTCVPYEDASVPMKNRRDKIGPLSTIGFVTAMWMTVAIVAEILEDRGVKLFIHSAHNVPGDTTARQRLDEALAEYKRRISAPGPRLPAHARGRSPGRSPRPARPCLPHGASLLPEV